MLEETLESPLDSKEIQSILKEISPEYLLEGLMLKVKLHAAAASAGREVCGGSRLIQLKKARIKIA